MKRTGLDAEISRVARLIEAEAKRRDPDAKDFRPDTEQAVRELRTCAVVLARIPVRYAVTHMGKNGLRGLTRDAHGRCMSKDRSEAVEWLKGFLDTNGEARLAEVYGKQAVGTFRVDAFDCYDHGDPKGVYVNRYRVSFTGCTRGAIGIHHACSVVVEASGKEAAVMACYETHDHISFPKVTEIDT